MKVSGHKILVTGATKGIGLALSKRFLQLGNTVIATGRDVEALRNLQVEFPQVITYCYDLSNQSDLEQLVAEVENKHHDLNMLINNAGIQFNYDLLTEENIVDRIAYEVEVNLVSPMKLTAMLLPVLMSNEHPAVINVSSALGIAPKSNAVIYSATKAGLHAFSIGLRHQQPSLAVYEILPSLVDTAMTKGRGKNKISPEELVDEFLHAFERNIFEINIGKVKLLRLLHRLSPSIANKIINQKS